LDRKKKTLRMAKVARRIAMSPVSIITLKNRMLSPVARHIHRLPLETMNGDEAQIDG
jgi:hypothetical protein